MIFSIVVILLGAIATVVACKSINSGFDLKNQDLDGKEKALTSGLEELRLKRRERKRELESLKQEVKLGIKSEPEKPANKVTLKAWLIDSDIVDPLKYAKAEKFADEKNLDILSALLTLSMITIETYEKAKQMKIRQY